MNSSSIARVKETFEQWGMYDAVVRHGYMHHAELVAELATWVGTRKGPLRIVDLGCGDAWVATNAFRGADVEEYLGVDVSQASVDRAVQNLECWPGRARVACGNLADVLEEIEPASVNLVLASFSLHHFQSDQKRAILDECNRILMPGGALVWVDAVRGEAETRDDYVRRLADRIQRDWTGLTEAQRASACAHVLESDFPETANWMRDAAEQVGVVRGDTLLQKEFFSGWVFEKRLPERAP